MRGRFSSRRRADEFEALLSRAGRGHSVDDAELAELLEVVGTLRTLPEVSARPAFVSDLRSRLMAEAAAQPARPARQLDDALVARLTPSQRRGRSERRLATVLGGFAAVAATGSMAMASQAALPGDVLYPVKRAIENAHTNLQGDDASRASVLLAHAEQRLAEVEALSARDGGSTDAEEIATTLHDFTEQTKQATSLAIDEYEDSADEGSLQDVRTFAGRSMDRLTTLGEAVPEEARPALITAAQTIRQVDSAARQACPTCGGSITELPDFATRSLDRLVLPPLSDDTSAVERPRVGATPPRPGNVDPPARDRQPRADEQPDQAEQPDPTTPPADRPVDQPTDPLPDDRSGPLGDITDGVKGVLGGKGGKKSGDSGDKGLVEGVVDGVDGLLGGLLGGAE